ncbi:unnamed protein product, partial [Citrullus colocynthis]
ANSTEIKPQDQRIWVSITGGCHRIVVFRHSVLNLGMHLARDQIPEILRLKFQIRQMVLSLFDASQVFAVQWVLPLQGSRARGSQVVALSEVADLPSRRRRPMVAIVAPFNGCCRS